MELRHWAYLLFALVLIVLIYNFLTTIFKTDQKRFTHDRIYVDYTAYRKPAAATTEKSTYTYYSPVLLQKIETARSNLGVGKMELATELLGRGMQEALEKAPLDLADKPSMNTAFEKYKALGAQSLPELSRARQALAQKKYPQALQELTDLLNSIDKEDYTHLLQIYESLAECQLHLKDQEGYVSNKVNYVKTMRVIRELHKKVYPNQQQEQKTQDWISTEEATKQLLQVRIFANEKLGSPDKENVIRRAEFDVEVARRLAQ